MRAWQLVLLFCLAAVSHRHLVLAEDEEDSKHVRNLTNDNFDEQIKSSDYALVAFTAPWCGHCKSLKPHWAKVAEALEGDKSVFLANVDATVETELAKKFDVSGYPTIAWFDHGKKLEYTGGRTTDEILKWIKKKTGPPAETVESVASLEDVKEREEVFLLGYFESFEGEDYEAFQGLARETNDVSFFQTTAADVAKALGVKKAPGFAIGTGFEAFGFQSVPSAGHEAFKANSDSLRAALEAFLQAEKLPPYLEFSSATQPKIFGSGIKKQVLIMGTADQLDSKGDAVKAIVDTFKAHKGELVFVTVNKDTAEGPNVLKFFDAPEGDDVLVYGFNQDKGHKFKMDGKLTAKTLKAFAKDLVADTLPVVYKSEPIPTGAAAKDGDVVVVVGKSFEDVCLDPKKDVLLEVYAPWCGHCKSLAPIYKKLAKRFKKVDSVVIAKLDGTANEHKELDVKSFPTLIFYPAGKGAEAIPFDGERTLKGMTKFLKKHAAVPFELKKKDKEDHEEL